jgi:prepilin-type N-terminal cleavage/methylation domain-containing protein
LNIINKLKQTKSGFTLVEAIVVLLVFGILMAGMAAVFAPIARATSEMRRDALADMTADTIQNYVRHSIQNAYDLTIFSDAGICKNLKGVGNIGEARALIFDADGKLYEVRDLEAFEKTHEGDDDNSLKISTLLSYVRVPANDCGVFSEAFYSRRSVIVPSLIASPDSNELNFTLTIRASNISDYTIVTVKTYIMRFFNKYATNNKTREVLKGEDGNDMKSDVPYASVYSDGSYTFSSNDGSQPLILYYHLVNP